MSPQVYTPGPTLPCFLEPGMIETKLGAIECSIFGKGPDVLCLHGAMGGYDQSALLARTIGEGGYRYHCVSRPGYLRTPLALGKSPDEQADLYAAMLDALGIERVGVMAVSGGGYSAIHFALRHPQRCWGMVLVSTTADKVTTPLPWAYHLLKILVRMKWFQSMNQRKSETQPEAVARRSVTNPQIFERLLNDQEAWALMKQLQLSTSDRMNQRFPGTNNDVLVTRSCSFPLEAIQIPTLVVHGTADPLVPYVEHAEVFAKRISGSRLVSLEGGEHAAIFTHRQEARREVCAFLADLAPRT